MSGSDDEKATGSTDLKTVDYVSGYYAELAPVHINYVAALNGFQPVPLDRGDGFDYCELGCGLGDTTNLLAAATPAGRFLGIDLSDSHIERAAEQARTGGLENVRFLAADIEKLDAATLPDFDFITMHGLYAWVPPSTQQAILRFLDAKLKPGGLVSVSYNCFPGTQNLSIVRRFALERAAQLDGDLLTKVETIVAELEDLRAAQPPLLAENPSTARFIELLRDSDKRYVVHELFASDWSQLSSRDVHRAMTGIGLRYVGDGEVLENFLEHSCHEKQVERLQGIEDRIEREFLKDFLHNRCFRRDVYQRSGENDAKLDVNPIGKQLFSLSLAAAETSDKVKIYGGELTLQGAWFERVKELLSYEAMTLDEILSDSTLASCSPDELRKGILAATIGGAIRPVARRCEPLPPAPPTRFKLTLPINGVLLTQYNWQRPRVFLASQVTGNHTSVTRMEAVLLRSFESDDPARAFRDLLQAHHLRLTDVAKQADVSESEEETEAIQQILHAFLNVKLPKLWTLGLVTSADA